MRKVNFGFPREWEMKNHRISPDGKYLAFMTHARPKAHFHWVNIANPEIESSEEGTGGGIIFSPEEDVIFKFGYNPIGEVDENGKPVTYSIITRTNILTGEQQITRVKERNICGLSILSPVAITNLVAQGR